MKGKFLRLDSPCAENWDEMSAAKNGRFCQNCAKSVIDFTVLDEKEINRIIKKSKGKLCARMKKTQLSKPIFDQSIPKTFTLPYSNAAAGLIIAASLLTAEPVAAENHSQSIELVPLTNTKSFGEITSHDLPIKEKIANQFTSFNGIVFSEKTGKPIENAKVIYVTLTQIIVTHTKADGTFSMQFRQHLSTLIT